MFDKEMLHACVGRMSEDAREIDDAGAYGRGALEIFGQVFGVPEREAAGMQLE